MNDIHDDDLRPVFGALKRENESSVPSFASMTSVAAMQTWQRRRLRRRGAILATALFIPVALIALARRERVPDFERFTALTGLNLGEVTWTAPSDFLLDVPGRDLLRRVPLIEVQLPALTPDSARPSVSNTTKRRTDS
jgi:hypothetical protein